MSCVGWANQVQTYVVSNGVSGKSLPDHTFVEIYWAIKFLVSDTIFLTLVTAKAKKSLVKLPQVYYNVVVDFFPVFHSQSQHSTTSGTGRTSHHSSCFMDTEGKNKTSWGQMFLYLYPLQQLKKKLQSSSEAG